MVKTFNHYCTYMNDIRHLSSSLNWNPYDDSIKSWGQYRFQRGGPNFCDEFSNKLLYKYGSSVHISCTHLLRACAFLFKKRFHEY